MSTKKRLTDIFQIFFPFVLSVFFFLAAHYAVFNCLSTVHGISITLTADYPDTIQLYYDNSRFPVFTEKKSSTQNIHLTEQVEVIHFGIREEVLTGVRIDTGVNLGKIRIYQIVFQQPLKRKTVVTATEIYNNFSSSLNNNIILTLEEGYVEITVIGEDPYFVSVDGFLPIALPLFSYIPIFILTFYFYQKALTIPPRKLLSFIFPRRELPSDNSSILEPLDGLRGFAILLVVAEHTLPSFIGAGHSGVLIFFALSGFLLTKPFVSQPQKICGINPLVQYGGRRLKRILPMYYLYLFLVYGMSLQLDQLTMHAFFIEGRGHLWTIPQEMVFYILFPILIMTFHKVFKNNVYAIISFLLLFVYFWQHWISTDILYLFGMADKKIPLLIPIFLCGSFFSYIYFGIWEKHYKNKPLSHKINYSLTTIAAIIVLLFLTFSNGNLIDNTTVYSMKYRIGFGFCAGFLVFLVCCTGKNVFTKSLSSLPLTSIGVVSYSLYLIHPLVINLLEPLCYTGFTLFVAVLSISYLFACFTYHFIENPYFIKKQK